ncbi:MAG: OmpH family outer membrane protein [Saprospiraceae bacterium]|nr:OmpH family outer membrane protein [Saprospiraceae bacterium]
MKTTLKITSLLIVLFCVAFSAQAQKFGYINSNAILAEMPQVKQADATLEALQKQLQKKGQGMVEQFQKDYAAVQQKVERGELSPKQQEEEAKKLETAQTDIQKFEQEMVQQLQTRRNELMEPILKSVNDAIQGIAKEGGFQFIFDEAVLLYKDASMDVTAQVKAKLGIATP